MLRNLQICEYICSCNCTKFNRSLSTKECVTMVYYSIVAMHIFSCMYKDSSVNNHVVLITVIYLKMQCTILKALELFNMINTSNKSVVAIVGCGCSSATEVIASRSDIPVVCELLNLDMEHCV